MDCLRGNAEIFSAHSTFPEQFPVRTGIHNSGSSGQRKTDA